jgi:hypothetical protein
MVAGHAQSMYLDCNWDWDWEKFLLAAEMSSNSCPDIFIDEQAAYNVGELPDISRCDNAEKTMGTYQEGKEVLASPTTAPLPKVDEPKQKPQTNNFSIDVFRLSPNDVDRKTTEAAPDVLPTSRSPVYDTFLFCALKQQGAIIVDSDQGRVDVFNFHDFLSCTYSCCSKLNQAIDFASRIKTLKNHFDGIPRTKLQKYPFTMIALNINRFNASLNRLRANASQSGKRHYSGNDGDDYQQCGHPQKRRRQ